MTTALANPTALQTPDDFCRRIPDCLQSMQAHLPQIKNTDETPQALALRIMIQCMAQKFGHRGRGAPKPKTHSSHRALIQIADAFLANFTFCPTESAGDHEALTPEILGRVVEEGMTGRYGAGAYYTPPDLARFICRQMLTAALQDVPLQAIPTRLASLRILDPACGGGAFLLAMLDELTRRYLEHSPGADPTNFRRHLVTHGLCGFDLNPLALYVAQTRLHLAAGVHAPHVAVGDSLLAAPTADRFDLVAANPPYVNVFEMHMNQKDYRRQLRDHYPTARGGFDLFVPFLQHCIDSLAPAGVLGIITPNKLLSAEYAAPIREYLLERMDLLALLNLSQSRIFRAGIYPVVTFARKNHPPTTGGVVVYQAPPGGGLPGGSGGQAGGDEGGILHRAPHDLLRLGSWSPLLHPDAPRYAHLLSGPTLADVATVTASATVAEAYHWRDAISEQSNRFADPTRYIPLVVSGSVRPHQHLWGREPVRYLKTTYKRPVLDIAHAAISAHRREQILAHKVLLSGLARRPTAVWCTAPLACGVATVLVIPKPGIRGDYLAAILNSDLLAKLYEILFANLALAGGYMRFGAPQLRRLPVPPATPAQQSRFAALRGTHLESSIATLWGLDLPQI